MSLVKGENYVFFIYNGGVWKPYVCARSGNMSIDTGMIETTVAGSGNYQTFEPSVHSFTASIDGIISLNVAASLTLPELQALQLAKTLLLCRFTQTSEAGDIYTKECYFYITNSTDTGSFDGIATFSLSLRGTGSITQVFTPPPPTSGEVFIYPPIDVSAPATTGNTTWGTPVIGKNVISVYKDGRRNNNMISTGTPVGNEVLYDSATGDLTWAVPFEDGETPPAVEYQNL